MQCNVGGFESSLLRPTGVEFKRAFLGPSIMTGLPEPEVLRALAETDRHSAFDPASLLVRPKSTALWELGEEAWGLMSRLLVGAETPLSEAVVGGLIEAMPADALLAALDAGGHVLGGLVRRRPQIAATLPYWSPPAERQSRAVKSLAAGGDGVGRLMPEIICAALEAGADPVDPNLVDVFGDRSVPIILEWLDGSPERPSRLPFGWKASLRRKSSQMLAWVRDTKAIREETVRFILSDIDIVAVFRDRELVVTLSRFLPTIEAASVEHAAEIASAALKVALNAASPEGANLAAASFDVVYRAAMHSQLPDDAWLKIACDLPQGYWWQEWDRCERLRRSVIEKFRSEQWPAAALVRLTSDDVLFGTLVAELRDSWSGRRVLQEAADSGVSGTGARRSEMVRAEVSDFDFEAGIVKIRERKRAGDALTYRQVPMSDRLRKAFEGAFSDEAGRFAVPVDPERAAEMPGEDAGPEAIEAYVWIASTKVTRGFRATLDETKWDVLHGLHVFRHSFVSGLARAGVDQRVIDELVGQETEAMRRRYRHLFPEQRQDAVKRLFGK